MRQILFTIPIFGVPIFGYGTMLFLAFIGSTQLAAWRARREKLDPELLYDLALWVFIGGLVGARLFYVIQYWGDRIRTVGDIFRIWEGGIVLYGSIMGGTAAFFFYRFLRPFPLRPLLDVVAPSLALGVALGRFGCFLNGCCYGDFCDLPVGVAFPKNSPPWNAQVVSRLIDAKAHWSLPVHPTQIYSSLDGLILLLLLTAYYPLRRRDGEVMALLMVTYPISRFLIEYLRNDEGAIFAGLTISQNISVLLFAWGLLYWNYLRRLPEGRYADQKAEPVLVAK
ncbi:prolipoprotein diacylglyceryl transferase [Singulisphaera acidiphila]|uniref:Phosphatidylglycerol--prolipoprotein diacylglyceryl transferase n=1 Tax=Singulisphaera acidiphila (strain ATCC BAA-1392 / DSM 18658 / VKM B-2454 / MOB10) TaxID=886293 RepID=L0DKW1_SINAD|nr:prolipoprotein diacylglyceryl transferase [Singulisphaera acidiphila]AGA29465.1 prolipoprotein diacylglyceryl transferase [Singulisphaera acidiphila DSM 18658]